MKLLIWIFLNIFTSLLKILINLDFQSIISAESERVDNKPRKDPVDAVLKP
jgi:hypothetical protein